MTGKNKEGYPDPTASKAIQAADHMPEQSPLSRSLGIFGDFERDFAFEGSNRHPQCHIQHHHHAEAHREKHRADVGVLPLRHFRDQFLHHHIQHGTGKKVKGFAVLQAQ